MKIYCMGIITLKHELGDQSQQETQDIQKDWQKLDLD